MLKRFGGVNMNPIIKILMERDEMSKQEATELYNQVQEMIMENPMEAEEIMLLELGLEMDYIFDIV